MALFDTVIDGIIKDEGGMILTNKPHDRGGKTYAGISQISNPDWEGWELLEPPFDLHVLERTRRLSMLVKERYKTMYWDKIHGDEIPNRILARLLMTIAVISGPETAIEHFQHAVNTDKDDKEKVDADAEGRLSLDGVVGTQTLKAFSALADDPHTAEAIIYAVTILHTEFLLDIVKRDREQHVFFFGWVSRLFLAIDIGI